MKNFLRSSRQSGHWLKVSLVMVLLAVLASYGYSHSAPVHNESAQEELPVSRERGADPIKVTVREAQQAEYHNTYIEISGVVLRQTGPQSVLIHDGTAAIEIELRPSQVPVNGLKANTRLRIKGEIAHDGRQNTHEVEVTEVFWSF